MMSALGYTWTAVYVAFFFRPNAARLYAVAVAILTRLNARLRPAVHIDGLIGLLNRSGFALRASHGVRAALRFAHTERRPLRWRDRAAGPFVVGLSDGALGARRNVTTQPGCPGGRACIRPAIADQTPGAGPV